MILFIVYSCSGEYRNKIKYKANTDILYKHVEMLTSTEGYRNFRNIKATRKAANYIEKTFKIYSENVFTQSYDVDSYVFKNIISTYGPKDGTKIIIGAHYDVADEQPGADDNASGIAGLLEISRLLKLNEPKLKYGIDLVAYPLEEPPWFKTKFMGSFVHSDSIYYTNVDVRLMICLEMIGFFNDNEKSQTFPIGILEWFYPTVGNFILVVSNFHSHFSASEFKDIMQDHSAIEVFQITAPSFITGVDFSDHLNYWEKGYKAIMITDTAFYRNKNYHKKTDTINTLDFKRMAEVVNGTYSALVNID